MSAQRKSNLDLINDCDSFPYDVEIASLYKFLILDDPQPYGYMLSFVALRMPWTPDFRIDHVAKTVRLQPEHPTTTSATALQKLTDRAIEEDTFQIIHQEHSEMYPILGTAGLTIERYFTPLFGIISRGAHLTVYTHAGSLKEMKIWVPRRSMASFTYPGCLDTTVAGGLPVGESPFSCIIREADEEASLPEELVRKNAVACGALTYMQQSAKGDGGEIGLIAPDLVYVYDLEVDETIKCRPHDEEVQDFTLMTILEVQDALARAEFKTNSAVVMIDFLIRHGVITQENEKYYSELLMRMHRRLPFPTVMD